MTLYAKWIAAATMPAPTTVVATVAVTTGVSTLAATAEAISSSCQSDITASTISPGVAGTTETVVSGGICIGMPWELLLILFILFLLFLFLLLYRRRKDEENSRYQ